MSKTIPQTPVALTPAEMSHVGGGTLLLPAVQTLHSRPTSM